MRKRVLPAVVALVLLVVAGVWYARRSDRPAYYTGFVEGEERVLRSEVNGRVHLRVIDRGPGIAPENRAKVLEPFQRLGDRSSLAGVGLGLAVSRGFVQAVGGDLRLDDTPGGGLTVVIDLAEAS